MRRLVLACAALACLVGCSGQPDPIEPTSGSSSKPRTSPGPISTLTPPALPKLAERNDATGAANFVLYWVKVSNYAALTGDTELLRSISSPDCEGCNRYIELYERTYAAGGYIRGASEQMSNVMSEQGESETYTRATLSSPDGKFKPARSARVQQTPAESVTVVFASRRSRTAWIMTQVGLDK